MDQAAPTLSRRNLVLGLAGGTVLAGFIALLPVGTSPVSRQARRFAASNRWTRRFARVTSRSKQDLPQKKIAS